MWQFQLAVKDKRKVDARGYGIAMSKVWCESIELWQYIIYACGLLHSHLAAKGEATCLELQDENLYRLIRFFIR